MAPNGIPCRHKDSLGLFAECLAPLLVFTIFVLPLRRSLFKVSLCRVDTTTTTTTSYRIHLRIDADIAVVVLEVFGAMRHASRQDNGIASLHNYFFAVGRILERTYTEEERGRASEDS